MVIFKEWWGKLYYLFFFFSLRNKYTHTRERKRGSNTNAHHNFTQKPMVTFKGGWGKLYYTQHTLLSNVEQLPILFFEKQTHTHTQKGEGKGF